MLQFEELKQALREKEPELRELSDDLGLEQTREEIEKLDATDMDIYHVDIMESFEMCRKIPRKCCKEPRP